MRTYTNLSITKYVLKQEIFVVPVMLAPVLTYLFIYLLTNLLT